MKLLILCIESNNLQELSVSFVPFCYINEVPMYHLEHLSYLFVLQYTYLIDRMQRYQ
jgi:hypothetical protein